MLFDLGNQHGTLQLSGEESKDLVAAVRELFSFTESQSGGHQAYTHHIIISKGNTTVLLCLIWNHQRRQGNIIVNARFYNQNINIDVVNIDDVIVQFVALGM